MPSVGTITGTLRLIDIFTGPLGAANAKLAATATKMQTTGRTMAMAGAKLSTAITLPALAAAGASFHFASQFEEAMVKVENLSGAGRENIQGWKTDLMALAEEAGRSPKELAEGLFFLSSSGLELSQVMDVLQVSAKGAAIGLGDTETIAGTLSVVVNAFTKEGLEAADALNTIALGVEQGTAEVDQFSPAFGRLASTAGAMGIAFSDVVGIMSVMSVTNLNVAETTTSLSQIFNTLLGSGEKSKKMLNKMGLSLQDLRDIAAGPQGLLTVLELLDQSFTLPELKLVFPNIRAFRGLMNVLAQDSEKVAEIFGKVASKTDLINKGFERVAKTAGFKFNQLISVILVEMIKLGDAGIFNKIFDQLITLVKWLGSLADAFKALPEVVQKAGTAFLIFFVLLGPGLAILGRFVLITNGATKAINALVFQAALLQRVGLSNLFTRWTRSSKTTTSAIGLLALKTTGLSKSFKKIGFLVAASPVGLVKVFKSASKSSGNLITSLGAVGAHLGLLSRSIVKTLPGGAALVAIFSSPITWIAVLALLVLSLKPVQEWIKKVWTDTENLRRLMVETGKVTLDWITTWDRLGVALGITSETTKGFTFDLLTLNPIVKLTVWELNILADKLKLLDEWFTNAETGTENIEKAFSLYRKTTGLLIPGLNIVLRKLEEFVIQGQENVEEIDALAAAADRLVTDTDVLADSTAFLNATLKTVRDQIIADAKAKADARLATEALAAAQAAWGEAVKGLQTPFENYLDNLRDLITTGKAAGASTSEITEQVLRLKSAIPLEGLEVLSTSALKTALQIMGMIVPDIIIISGHVDDIEEGWDKIGKTVDEVAKQGVQDVIDGAEDANHWSVEIGTAWDGIKHRIREGAAAVAELAKNTEMWGSIIGEAVSGLLDGDSFEDTLGNAGGQAGQVFGAAFGSAFGPIGTAIGGAVGEKIGEKIGQTIGKFIDGGMSIGQKVREFFDRFDEGTATVNETVKAMNLLTMAVTKMSAKKAGKIMAEHFDMAFEAAKRLGGAAVDALARLAAAARETGKGIEQIEEARKESVEEFISTLQERADLFRSSAEIIIGGIAKMGLTSKNAIEFAGTAIVQAFNAMVLSGASILEIVDMLGEQFDRIGEAGNKLGIEMPEEFARIGVVIAALSDGPLKKAITSLEGMGEIAKAVGDIGMLTAEQFTTFGKKIKGTFNKLVEGGLSGQEALASIAPQLQTLWDLSQQYGFAIDKNTMSLIKKAGALGLVTDKGLTTEDILIKGFDKILESLNAIVVALGGVPIALDEWVTGTEEVESTWDDSMSTMGDDIEDVGSKGRDAMKEIADGAKQAGVDATEAWDKATTEIPGKAKTMLDALRKEFESIPIELNIKGFIQIDGDPPKFAKGSGGIQDFGSQTMAMLHGREEIITQAQGEGVATMVSRAIRAGLSGGSDGDLLEHASQQTDLMLRAHQQRDRMNRNLETKDKGRIPLRFNTSTFVNKLERG